MRWVVATVAVAGLLVAPAASAKTLTKVVAVGAGDIAVEVRGLDWTALRATPVTSTPDGGYVLVYPLMERGLPAEPGRFYPAAQIACYSWDRSVVGECWRVADSLAMGLAGLPQLDGPPTILAALVVSHRNGNLGSNGAVAIELAFARRDHARTVKKRPRHCVRMRATWTGPNAGLRPTRFWACHKGLWAAKKLYPVGPLLGI